MKLAEIAEVRSGWAFPKKFQGRAQGDLPFYKVSDMNLKGNESFMRSSSNYVSFADAKQLGVHLVPAGAIIFPKIGAAIRTNKKRLLSSEAAFDNNVMAIIPGDSIQSMYLYFWMLGLDLSDLANDSGAVPSIRKTEVEGLRVPLPGPATQAKIVDVLTRFETLVNDLSSGLPAEIQARRKQYEYYRDKLLSFPEKQG